MHAITGDELWVYQYDLEMKHQTGKLQILHAQKVSPVKVKSEDDDTQCSDMKLCTTSFYSWANY